MDPVWRIIKQCAVCNSGLWCDKGKITPYPLDSTLESRDNEVGDYCRNCRMVLWKFVSIFEKSHGASNLGLSVHSVVVTCPNEKCDSLQTVPLERSGVIYYPKEDYRCSVCGKSFSIMGDLLVAEMQSFSEVLADHSDGQKDE